MFGFSSPFCAPKSPSRRPRNPRFAPESLERRLLLSDVTGLVVTADVEPIDDPNDPMPNPDGTPPTAPFPIPHGPVLPA